MKLWRRDMPEQNSRALLAKLVIGLSALVALATSAPPEWLAQEQGQLHLVFDEQNERTAILRIEISGKLYRTAQGGALELLTTADRDASDLRLTVRPLPSDAAVPDPTDAASEAEAEQSLPILGVMDSPDLSSPTMAWLSVPIECAQDDPGGRRPKSCVEQFEITLTRSSQRPLSVDLTAMVDVSGPGQTPPGTLQVFLVERAP